MTDQPNQPMPSTNDPQDSYVDSYQPPQPGSPTQPPAGSTAPVPPTPMPPGEKEVDELVPEPAAAVPAPAPATPDEAPEMSSSVSQALEDQNVFNLLGVEDAPEDEKESFLDELQQVIWEDFIENDVQLLITDEEMVGLKAIMDKPVEDELQKQEEIVVYLEKLIPDLEEVMLEKALELKADMMRERLTGMKEYYADQPETVAKIDQASDLVNQDKWREAAALLNTIT